jgi:flavin reductase (DIM6/NTAB) family NADH-FMN oxidoreductase RutF
MAKVPIGARTLLYPLPTVLVGANVNDKPNFMAVAWCGIVNSRPPMLSVSLQYPRHTLKGIKQNNTFSVNIPSVDKMLETDYCGIFSGSERNKVADCKFAIFYGKLLNAPMVNECPVNIECSVLQTVMLPSHELIIGHIEETYITDSCLTGGDPDVNKIKPFLWVTRPTDEYWTFGEPAGKAHSMGKEMKRGLASGL